MEKRGQGSIVIPSGVSVWPHEIATAQALAAAGKHIEFLRPAEGQRVKSADMQMDGIVWEMESPETRDCKSLQRTLRRAGRQSPNVIVDALRMNQLDDATIEHELRRLKPLVKSIRRLLFITKDRRIVDIG